MAVTPLPVLDRTSPTFRSDVDTFFASKLQALVPEINATEASMNAAAAGGAYSIPYIFDSITADADPTAYKLRLNNAVQNGATVLRLALVAGDTRNWTSVLDTFDASTSVKKGQIRLAKMGDASKWLTFDVTARAAPAGYRNFTIVNTGGSTANPFTAGDSLMLFFNRTGDKGDVGPAAATASAAEVRAGADAVKLVTPATVLAALGFSAYVQTADQTVTLGGSLTIAHGLGRPPVQVQGFLRCVTADRGYAVGDVFPIHFGSVQTNGSSLNGVQLTMDASNLYTQFGGVFSLAAKGGASAAAITPASWAFFLRAFA